MYYYVVNLYSGHAFLHIGGFNPGYIGALACLLYLFYTLCMTVRLDVNFFCLTSNLISITNMLPKLNLSLLGTACFLFVWSSKKFECTFVSWSFPVITFGWVCCCTQWSTQKELDIKIWKHESQTKLLKNTNEMWAAFICCSERWPLEEKWTPANDIIRISCQKHSVLTMAILNPIPFRFLKLNSIRRVI